ncbi:hypothetical protein J2125_000914 [Erwinia toletana]|uniref:Cyanophage baseplate Pam3 plug gp18 domain-containing protein n=1 Tax=Winslowiella toletana TaxID=92490 RepID=A0ABS4P6C4_9GAMM|nr:hypothetical protein [Winslowiella toletana]MBP2167722.1 hypothetical protein [Winslowiella toletana]
MQYGEIPLTPDNQQFTILIGNLSWRIRLLWRDDAGWIMDLQQSDGTAIISGIPLVSGVDLLAQYNSLGFGFSLYFLSDVDTQQYATKTDLGSNSHLYVVTE